MEETITNNSKKKKFKWLNKSLLIINSFRDNDYFVFYYLYLLDNNYVFHQKLFFELLSFWSAMSLNKHFYYDQK